MASVDILQTLGNKYSAEILDATDEPQSAQELSDELGIPIATCYRRIDGLLSRGIFSRVDLLGPFEYPEMSCPRSSNSCT